MGEPKAYQVFNPSMTSPKLTYSDWQTYNGDQMLVCFSTENPTNDDWLISPLLSGKKQNISFMAKTVDATWGKEKIEIWYSTTGTDAADFVKLTEEPYEDPHREPSVSTHCLKEPSTLPSEFNILSQIPGLLVMSEQGIVFPYHPLPP